MVVIPLNGLILSQDSTHAEKIHVSGLRTNGRRSHESSTVDTRPRSGRELICYPEQATISSEELRVLQVATCNSIPPTILDNYVQQFAMRSVPMLWCVYPSSFARDLDMLACQGDYANLDATIKDDVQAKLRAFRRELCLEGGDPAHATGIVMPWLDTSAEWPNGGHWMLIVVRWANTKQGKHSIGAFDSLGIASQKGFLTRHRQVYRVWAVVEFVKQLMSEQFSQFSWDIDFENVCIFLRCINLCTTEIPLERAAATK